MSARPTPANDDLQPNEAVAKARRLREHAAAVARLLDTAHRYPQTARGLTRCAEQHLAKAAALCAELQGSGA